jgi:hypothetical protein
MLSTVSSEEIQKARRMAKRTRANAACSSCKSAKTRCSDFRPCKRCTDSKAPCDGEHFKRKATAASFPTTSNPDQKFFMEPEIILHPSSNSMSTQVEKQVSAMSEVENNHKNDGGWIDYQTDVPVPGAADDFFQRKPTFPCLAKCSNSGTLQLGCTTFVIEQGNMPFSSLVSTPHLTNPAISKQHGIKNSSTNPSSNLPDTHSRVARTPVSFYLQQIGSDQMLTRTESPRITLNPVPPVIHQSLDTDLLSTISSQERIVIEGVASHGTPLAANLTSLPSPTPFPGQHLRLSAANLNSAPANYQLKPLLPPALHNVLDILSLRTATLPLPPGLRVSESAVFQESDLRRLQHAWASQIRVAMPGPAGPPGFDYALSSPPGLSNILPGRF